MSSQPLSGVAIMGATGTGKSGLAIELAERFGGEIISMDSRQVYRGFDIGTAKVGADDRRRVPHHLIDIIDPEEPHSAGRHCAMVTTLAREIAGRGGIAWLAGGTGFYFRALFEGLIDVEVDPARQRQVRVALDARDTESLYRELAEVDAARAAALNRNDRMRVMRALEIFLTTGIPPSEHAGRQPAPPPWSGPRFVLSMPRDKLRSHIARRTRALYAAGWSDEVRRLLELGVPHDAPAMNSLGYSAIAGAIERGEDPDATVDAVITQTRQYAKRQETFFRGIAAAEWIDVTAPDWKSGVAERVSAWAGL